MRRCYGDQGWVRGIMGWQAVGHPQWMRSVALNGGLRLWRRRFAQVRITVWTLHCPHGKIIGVLTRRRNNVNEATHSEELT